METEQYFFADDGAIPNSYLPVVVYRSIYNTGDCSAWLEKCFSKNGWTNNWRDIVLTYHHFHSSTHEVLGVGKGEGNLIIGGADGKKLTVSAGDVIIIPAGVGHCSVGKNDSYEMVGGYPSGANWDLLTGTPEERLKALPKIKSLPVPATDPVFGNEGTLIKLWKNISG